MTQSSNPLLARTSDTLFDEAQRYIPGGVIDPLSMAPITSGISNVAFGGMDAGGVSAVSAAGLMGRRTYPVKNLFWGQS